MSVIPCSTKISNKGLQYLHKVKCDLTVDNAAGVVLFTLFCIMVENLVVTQMLSYDTLGPRSKWPQWPLLQLLPMQVFHKQQQQLQ